MPDKLEDGHVDKFYSVQLKSDSEMPVKWKLCGENKLPEGFTFSEDGVLSGMPKRMGYYSFGVQADNGELLVYKKSLFRSEAGKERRFLTDWSFWIIMIRRSWIRMRTWE